MARKLFTNNAVTTLAASISSGATSCAATSGGGALFPAIAGGSGNTFQATLLKIVTGVVTAFEIIVVTARATDTFTIVRGQEGTTALAFSAGDTLALLPTAADLSIFAQAADIQAFAGNYAVDTGVANAYSVALTPALSAHQVGTPIVWKAANTNTGASSFNDGVGSTVIATSFGALTAGQIIAAGIYIAVWNGSFFNLINPTIRPPLAVYKATNTSRSTNAISPDPDLAVGLDALVKYAIKAVLFIGGGTNGGLSAGLLFSAASTGGLQIAHGLANNGQFFSSQIALNNTNNVISVPVTQVGDCMILEGTVFTTVAGTLEIVWGQDVTNATAQTLRIGSYLSATPTF